MTKTMTSIKPIRETDSGQVRIIIWTFPRTLSTALTKCLSQIADVEVWFEPYCFCSMAAREYQRAHGHELPTCYRGNETKFAEAARLLSRVALMPPGVIDPERLAYEGVKERLESTTSKYVIVKDMAFSMSDEKYRRYLPDGFTHTFLTREPVASITSYRQATYKSFMSAGYLVGEAKDENKFDIERDNFLMNAGLFHRELYDLWKHSSSQCSKASGFREQESSESSQLSVVIESDDLRKKPHEVLQKFCRALGLPYYQSLLQWDASVDVAFTWKAAGDEVLRHNVHFYETAMTSSHFVPPNERAQIQKVSEDVRRLSEKARPYYEEMSNHKL